MFLETLDDGQSPKSWPFQVEHNIIRTKAAGIYVFQ
jgi:hypothetical protein